MNRRCQLVGGFDGGAARFRCSAFVVVPIGRRSILVRRRRKSARLRCCDGCAKCLGILCAEFARILRSGRHGKEFDTTAQTAALEVGAELLTAAVWLNVDV